MDVASWYPVLNAYTPLSLLVCLLVLSPWIPYVLLQTNSQAEFFLEECRISITVMVMLVPVPVPVCPTEFLLTPPVNPRRLYLPTTFHSCIFRRIFSQLPITFISPHDMPPSVDQGVPSSFSTSESISKPWHTPTTHHLSWSISPKNLVFSISLYIHQHLFFFLHYHFTSLALCTFRQCQMVRSPLFKKLLLDQCINPVNPFQSLSFLS